jgi:hypothetical protein
VNPSPLKNARLRELIDRTDRVLVVLHPPSAAHARIMEQAGCEAAFVGTGGVVGAYTGLADVGTATMTECVQIAGWIAQSVSFPVIVDGDNGHGGVMAVRRLVREGAPLTNAVADRVGDGVLMYALDYPHGESHFPKSVETVLGSDMAAARTQKLFWENAIRFYARSGPRSAAG